MRRRHVFLSACLGLCVSPVLAQSPDILRVGDSRHLLADQPAPEVVSGYIVSINGVQSAVIPAAQVLTGGTVSIPFRLIAQNDSAQATSDVLTVQFIPEAPVMGPCLYIPLGALYGQTKPIGYVLTGTIPFTPTRDAADARVLQLKLWGWPVTPVLNGTHYDISVTCKGIPQ